MTASPLSKPRRSLFGTVLVAVTVASLVAATRTWAVDTDPAHDPTSLNSANADRVGETPTLPTSVRSTPDILTGLIASPVTSPHPVVGADGKTHLVYELQLINVTQSDLAVRSVDTVTRRRIIAHLGQAAVAARMTPFATGRHSATLGPGGAGVLLLEITLAREAKVPTTLVHDFTVSSDPPTGLPAKERSGATRVTLDRPAVVAAPLEGVGWIDVNGCCGPGPHREAVNPINGAFYVAERFAIDFAQLSPTRRLFVGDPEELASWPSYGDHVTSATRGVVVGTKDAIADNEPVGSLPPIDLKTIGGNYVVVAFGSGHFAYYAHLQPGSLRARVGDRVRPGQVLGLLGNSGNSDFPHLHFQIMDTPSPLASDGLPYEFRSFTSPGSIANIDELASGEPAVFDPTLAGRHARQLPLDLQVVNFGAQHKRASPR
jgi:hypothetical protein